jgi:hypothetical protein
MKYESSIVNSVIHGKTTLLRIRDVSSRHDHAQGPGWRTASSPVICCARRYDMAVHDWLLETEPQRTIESDRNCSSPHWHDVTSRQLGLGVGWTRHPEATCLFARPPVNSISRDAAKDQGWGLWWIWATLCRCIETACSSTPSILVYSALYSLEIRYSECTAPYCSHRTIYHLNSRCASRFHYKW